jgi:hypothetical protein
LTTFTVSVSVDAAKAKLRKLELNKTPSMDGIELAYEIGQLVDAIFMHL